MAESHTLAFERGASFMMKLALLSGERLAIIAQFFRAHISSSTSGLLSARSGVVSGTPSSEAWQIRVDTGGTFTDCWALAPGDPAPRLVKVLSSGKLRIAIAERIDSTSFRLEIPANWNVPDGFFVGFQVGDNATVTSWDISSQTLGISAAEEGESFPTSLELSTGEEAPVLGARLITGAGLNETFPLLDFRLATTRATNALLERKGAPVAFFVTRGFGDLLVIRDQRRADLFALNHTRPTPLYETVIEVDERLAADGTVLEAIDLDQLEETAKDLLGRGIRVAAVALLHSHENSAHERVLREKLLKFGFDHVSLSSKLAPLIKIVPRAETAVVNAYLTPVMEAFVKNVRSAMRESEIAGKLGGNPVSSDREFVPLHRFHQTATESIGGRSFPTVPVVRAQAQLPRRDDEGIWTSVDSSVNAEEIRKQEDLLEVWTRANGLFWEWEDIDQLGRSAGHISIGNEHRAFLFEKDHLIVRLTIGNQYGLPWKTPRQYLHRWVEFNAFTPKTACEFLGFARNAEGKGIIITVQPFVAGQKPHPDEIMDEMAKLGFETGDGIIYYREDGVEMADVTPDNVRIDEDGVFRLFDTWVIDRDQVLVPIEPEEEPGIPVIADDSLLLMTSAGGLEPAATFRPKDSLLSGPAGGVAGAAAIARDLGLPRVITFDMGGTSTDVARYDEESGGFQYQFEQRIGDATLLAPALKIHTVAAGGGSICYRHEVTGEIRVGPQSAGADPGPACYGRGGPLTLTDVNLLLGRIDPANFGIPIGQENITATEKALTALVSSDTDTDQTAFLKGLLEIGIEQMADAIRTISIQDGADPAEYALLAFGGAGPLHACDIAERLGMTTIIVPAEAGVLSAYGLHQAEVERFAERQILSPYRHIADQIDDILEELKTEAGNQLRADLNVTSDDFSTETRRQIVEVRLKGQDSTLTLELDKPTSLVVDFRAEYESIFGYPPPENREIEIVTLRVVVSKADVRNVSRVTSSKEAKGVNTEGEEGGSRQESGQFVDRSSMKDGDIICGPRVIQDAFATLFVKADWEAEMKKNGVILASRD